MAYDELLVDRITGILKEKRVPFEDKKMMGGMSFMVDDKMCVGIIKNELMARIDPDKQEEYLMEEYCREMDFTGRPVKGFIMVEPRGIDLDSDLDRWVDRCLEFNPKAKSSKKKKK